MTQDINFIDSGYFTPDGYYTYQADAASAVNSSFGFTAACGVIKATSVALTVTATQTTYGGKIDGIDIYAFSNATLATLVNRLRDNNVAVSTFADIATTGTRILQFSAEEDASATINTTVLRVRSLAADISAASSMTANVDVIAGGVVREFHANLSSTFDQSVAIGNIKQASADLTAQFTVAATGQMIGSGNTTLTATTSVQANNVRTRNFTANEFATASSSMVCRAIRKTDITLLFGAQVSATGTVSKSLVSNLTSSFTIATAISRTRNVPAALTTTATQTCDGIRLLPYWFTSDLGNFYAATNDPNGNVVAVGANGNIIYYDGFGTITREYAIDNTANTNFVDVILDSSGNLIMGGRTTSQGGSSQNAIIAKYNSSGTKVWQTILSTNNVDQISAIAQDSSGNTYGVGNTNNFAYIVKLNSSGVVQWQYYNNITYGGSFMGVAVDANNDVYAVGYNNAGSGSGIVYKFNSSGGIIWRKSFYPLNGIYSITPDKTSGVVIAGFNSSYYPIVIHVDATGSIIWQKQLSNTITMLPATMGLRQDSAGNTYGLFTISGNPDVSSVEIFAFDASGTVLFQNNINTLAGYEYPFGIAVNSAINTLGPVSSRLPLNGSGLGTYGSIIYSATTYTISTPSISVSNDSSPVLTAASLTSLSGTLATVSTTHTPAYTYITNYGVTKNATAAVSSSFTQTANSIRVLGTTIPLSSAATLSSTAIKYKNTTATLISSVTMGTVARANKVANSTLSVQAFDITAAGRIRPDVAGLQSTFGMVTNNTRVKSLTATNLSSTATVTVAPRKLKITTVAMSSTAAITAQARLPISHGRSALQTTATQTVLANVNLNPNADFYTVLDYTTQFKFTATTSLGNSQIILSLNGIISPNYLNKVSNQPLGTPYFGLSIWQEKGLYAGLPNNLNWLEFQASVPNHVDTATPNYGIKFLRSTYSNSTINSLDPNVWHTLTFHMTRNAVTGAYSGTCSINGVDLPLSGGSNPDSTTFNLATPWTQGAYALTPVNGFQVDSYNPGGASIQSSTFSTNLVTPAVASGDLSSTTTVTANVVKLRRAQAALSSSVTQNTLGYKIKSFSSALSASATQTTTANKSVTLTAQVNSIFTETASLGLIKRYAAPTTVTATQTAAPIKTVRAQANLSSQFTQTTNTGRIRNTASTVSSQAQQTATVARIARTRAAFTVLGSELTAAAKIGVTLVHAQTTASIRATGIIISGSATRLSAQFTQTATARKIIFGYGALTVSATQSLTPTYLRHTQAALSATASIRAINVRTRRTAIAQAVTATLTATDRRVRYDAANLSTQSSMLVLNQIIRLGRADVHVSSSLTASAFKLLRTEVHLHVQGFEIIAGQILHIDPYYQLKVRSETRAYLIAPESRVQTVKSETRVNKIRGKHL